MEPKIILGVTPARGGSKRILKKNIKEIAGKPLITWTIEAAKEASLLDRYIVSTEDEEITEISKKYGAEVQVRPPELATDQTSTLSVLQHVVEHVRCEIVVVLQATSPIRRKGLIDECVNEFLENGYDSLATGFLCKYAEYGKDTQRTQEVKGFFCADGNVYVIKADLIKKGERHGRNIGRKIVSRWENIDIDDKFDFWMAEKILKDSNYGKNEAYWEESVYMMKSCR